jgi:carboxypeptidase family protein
MARAFRLFVATIPVLLLIFATTGLYGQTATTGLISGTVTDASGASVPSATVEVTNTATGSMQKQSVNSSGQFVFPNVIPGEYTLKVTAQGFRTASVAGLRVEVTKSYVQDVKLEVGQLAETIEVTAEAKAELQMVDSTIGTLIPGKALPTMPLLTRQVNELLTAQAGATPTGEITGSRNDQSTFTLDGIDVTNNSVGGTNTFMYLGVEGIEEFRVGVANPNASFGRGSGGQVSLVGRHGSNAFHGGVYWYHQNDDLNANSWTNNRNKIKKPELKDNRFGFTAGGPAWKDKTFFFLNYDGRRFPSATTVSRVVPTDTLRQGILRFRDTAGNINSYNLATSQACGANGSGACDPRGLGLSPTISSQFKLLPAPNDFSLGDGLNTAGFTTSVGTPDNYGFFSARVDHNITNNWRLDASIRYFRRLQTLSNTIDIRNGNVASIRKDPTRQNFESIGVSGIIKPNLTADFRFGRVRNRTAADPQRPNASAALLNLPGANSSAGPIALDLGGRGGANNLLSEPFDIDTQLARKQQNDNRIYQLNADFNWIRGRHTIQFGGHYRNLPTLHRRDDKVLGALGALVAQIDSNLGPLVIPSTSAPPTCGAGRTTGCLQSADVQQWNRLFASATGMIDNVSVLAVRDGSFKPLPFGDLLESDTTGIRAPEFYVQDVWRASPTLTVTFGLNYGWQTSPTERLGRYTLQTDQASGQLIQAESFFTNRIQAMNSGGIFNPTFAFNPINNANGQSVFNIDWGTLAPRVGAAWNPSGHSGWLGKILGEKKTVLRGGFALIYDRQNTVQSVIIPSLGIGFAQTLNITTPACNITGAGGAGCNPTSADPVVKNFRVGIDGSIPVPTVPAQSVPVAPPWGLINGQVVTFPEILSFQVDPNMKVGRNKAIDFSIQREFKGDMILEVSYVGRYASRLPQGMNLLQSPYLQLDKASGQTFGAAFDAIAAQVRAGVPNANITPQPWFQNNVPGGSGTAAIVGAASSSFLNGNASNVFLQVDTRRMAAGLQPFNNYVSQMAMLRSSTGYSNYNGFLATLRKRFSKGFFYEVSYTYSKSLDQLGRVQNSANVTPNSFNLDAEYGPSEFDIRHVFGGVWSYDLPFKTAIPVLKHVVSGWNVSGIFSARSGDALVVTQANPVWGGGLFLATNSGAIPLVDPGSFGHSAASGVTGSNNIGTNANPGTGGSGLDVFPNPEQVFNSFRRVNIGSDGRSGRANPLYGMPRWNLDASVGKTTTIMERVRFRIGFDFFNILNKVDFSNPNLDLTNPRGFGVITSQLIPTNRSQGSRWIQASARIDF